MRPRAADLGWVALLFTVAALLQGLQDQSYFDGDTGYHLAVGLYTWRHGILHAFPWTPFSWLGHHYADKELALHLLLAPLSQLDQNVAARIAGTLLGGALLSTLYAILRLERAPRAGLWTLALLALSGAFTHRFVLVRPHLMSIPLALVALWAAARDRRPALFLAALAFPFCYTAWHLPVALGALAGGARALERLAADGRAALRPAALELSRAPALALLGAALGLALHPNFPENVAFFWIQNVEVLFGTAWAGREGFALGTEFKPFSPLGMLRYMLLPALLALGALAALRARRQVDPLALGAAAAALGMGLMTSQTQRFIEYFAPFALLAAAAAGKDHPRAPRLAAGLLALSLAYTGAVGLRPLQLLQGRSVMFPPDVEEAVQRLVPEGAQVFHCDWLTVGEMMLALPDRRFLFGLDPVLFHRGDPEAYQAWWTLLHSPPAAPGDLLRSAFAADYVLCDTRPEWRPLITALAADPTVEGPLQVGEIVLFRVGRG